MSENNKSYIRKSQYENIQLSIYLDAKGHLLDLDLQHLNQAASTQPEITMLIDHTLLKPEATEEQIRTLCEEALEYKFGAVCVISCWVSLCSQLLQGSSIKVASVIGFPWGTPATAAKVAEARQALQDGACELDMVMNYGKLKSSDYTYVANDIREVVRLAHKHDALVKVILETVVLSEQEKVIACLIAKDVGADFVKTSTGFAGGGATMEDIALMRKVVGPDMGVKASGGVRSYADAQKMLAAGATRIGTSSGIHIAQEAAGQTQSSSTAGGY